MIFHPANRDYIVEAVTEEMTDTGIVVPSHDHDTRPCFAKIVFAHADPKEPRKYQIGEIVYFDRFAAIQIDVREKRVYSVREEDIRGAIQF